MITDFYGYTDLALMDGD